MDIKYAILGFLSWKPFTGYEIKKMMTDSVLFYWSGNNNQIYTTLVELHRAGLVSNEVQAQERYPSRKVYRLTEEGQTELHRWALSAPEMPQFRKSFPVQLAWAETLSDAELEQQLQKYEYEINMQLLTLREQARRSEADNGGPGPARSARERYIWKMISENYIRSYATELQWVQDLRQGWPGHKQTT